MEVLLNIPNSKDWTTIYPLLQRLGISVISTKPLVSQPIPTETNKDWDIIMQGIDIQNIDDLMQSFDESRQDRVLPFRD